MFGLFDNPLGIVTDPSQLRPLTETQLEANYRRNLEGMRPATPSLAYLLSMQNYQPPERPLDERFADFKVRLAAAISRRTKGQH
jgi:hypothetical protein